MSEERKFKIISIPDEITLNKNNIYEFEIIPSDEFLTKEEYEGIPIRLVSLQKVEQLEKENKKLNNIINELEKELNKKKEAIKTIKDMLGEETKNVNPHIEVLETEYKYFLDKLKELKENNKDV